MKTIEKKTSSFAWVSCLLVILLTACGQTPTPIDIPEEVSPEILTETVYDLLPTEPPPEYTSSPTLETEETGSVFTQIIIDGDPSDWESYEVIYTDTEGDYQDGGFDIAAIRAFTNDAYLYILIETYFPATDFVQLDLDVRSGARTFVISFWPGTGQEPFMGEVTTGEWTEVGPISNSASALGEAVEIKMPLVYFEDVADLQLRNVRPMGGQCCGEGWYAIDDTGMATIAKADEFEPAVEGPQTPQVCAYRIPPPVPFGSLDPAPLELMEPGYAAEWFVAPGAFNMPQEILVTPKGEVLVYAVRSHTLSRLTLDGTITLLADNVWGYLGDVDTEGNVYLHMHPAGMITRISPQGAQTLIAQSSEIQTACDSGFGFGPDGNLYVAVSRCTDKGDLFQITTSGRITRVAEVPQIQALRTAPDGRFLAATYDKIYELSLDDYSLTVIGGVQGGDISPGGITFDNSGNIYISTGPRRNSGKLYRLSLDGSQANAELVTEIPENGVTGIEWLPSTGEVIGGQLRQGGILAISPDGKIREIVSGNGIITPMGIGFSPCGDLVVPCDDGGMMALVGPNSQVSWFFDYVSFIPPIPYVAFDPEGTLYASEGAPGFPGWIIFVPPGGNTSLRFSIADFPSGLAYSPDGVLYASETSAGRIIKINSNQRRETVAEGLYYPQALAVDMDNILFAVAGPFWFVPEPSVSPAPLLGDRIIRITPQGEITTVVQLQDITDLAVGPDGELYATVGGDLTGDPVGKVVRITPDGNTTVIASGFAQPRGLTFDAAGYLYVADEVLNGIARIAGFPQGTLSGVVTDTAGTPIEGARVRVLSVDPIVVGQVVFSDADSRFSLPVAPRTYSIIVTADGYEDVTLDGIEIIADQQMVVEIELEEQ
jgi:sugar lactone lactonase YvrE